MLKGLTKRRHIVATNFEPTRYALCKGIIKRYQAQCDALERAVKPPTEFCGLLGLVLAHSPPTQ